MLRPQLARVIDEVAMAEESKLESLDTEEEEEEDLDLLPDDAEFLDVPVFGPEENWPKGFLTISTRK